MTEADLLAASEELLKSALILARQVHEPSVVNAHGLAIKDGARLMVLQVVRTGRRVGLQAWTEARAGQGEDDGIFQLISIAERVDGEDWHAEGGC